LVYGILVNNEVLVLVSVGEGVVDAGTVAMTVAVVPVGLGPLIGVQY
jgi:hypothetical protein